MKSLWKRSLALFFALTLMLTLAAPAFAEEEEALPAETSDIPEAAETPVGEEPAEIPEASGEEAGEVKRIGGEEDEEPAAYIELYVSKDGSDEIGDGSEAAPFASLSRAAQAANETPELPVVILLLSDLEAKECARFTGRDVTIQTAAERVTVTRAGGFAPAKDEKGGLYNPAMIELRAPEGTEQTAGRLTLIGVILDDAGRHEGTLFTLPAAETPVEESPAEEAPAETPEAAEQMPLQDAAAPAEEPAPEDRTDAVQDAIVSVGDGGSLTLSTGAELRNFGGLAAVRLGDKSSLTLEPDSAIRDTAAAENTLPAVSAPESAKVETFDGAKLVERSALSDNGQLAADALPLLDEEAEGGFSSISFTADPESITRLVDSSWLQYPISYSMSFSVTERLKNLIEGAQSLITGSDGTVTITLDPRLTPDLSSCAFTSSVFALEVEPTFDEESHTITAAFKLKEDWTSHLGELTDPMSFTCTTSLRYEDFSPSTAEKDEYLESTGSVTLRLSTDSRTIGPYSTEEKTARTKMLGLPTATVVYDVNGGDAGSGPATEFPVSETAAHPLATEPQPTHAPTDGVDVVFLGWTAQPDSHIYEREEEKPETIEAVPVSGMSTVTVYAVYGADANSDGVADVDQRLVVLSFDPNGGENAPEPILHVVGSTDENGELGVNIPEQEPNRDYYTFVGWGETADATTSDKLYKYDAQKAARRDIPVTKDTTLYAVWEQNYQIKYDANGGANAPAATVLRTQTKTGADSKGNPTYTGRATITSGVPTRSGYAFQGWATSRRGAAAYFAGDEVEISGGSVTLYAVWTRTGSGSSTGGGSGSGSSSTAPKTGDSDMTAYLSLLGGSVLGLAPVGTVLWKKRRDVL